MNYACIFAVKANILWQLMNEAINLDDSAIKVLAIIIFMRRQILFLLYSVL